MRGNSRRLKLQSAKNRSAVRQVFRNRAVATPSKENVAVGQHLKIALAGCQQSSRCAVLLQLSGRSCNIIDGYNLTSREVRRIKKAIRGVIKEGGYCRSTIL